MDRLLLITDDGTTLTERAAPVIDTTDPDDPRDTVVSIDYSTLNYKDALAITGRGKIAERLPLVPGIDLVGTVETTTNDRLRPGDRVLVNGLGIGQRYDGGLAQHALVAADWTVPVPEELSSFQAAAIGTAGFTAMLAVRALEKHGVEPGSGAVLVTGAAGGAGSIAVAVLARLGHHVIASTGRPEETEYLTALGAADVLDRHTLSEPGRPLGKQRWVAAIDAVGSHTLANVLAQTAYDGIVAAFGMAQGLDLPGSVAPFILRGVTLAGIDSVFAARGRRFDAWERLARDLDLTALDSMTTTVSLAESAEASERLLAGSVRGRTVVDVNA